MDDELQAEIERLIIANCFAREEQVEGADFAAEAIVKLFEREDAENYRSTVLDLEPREE